jgi:hypothetical protein
MATQSKDHTLASVLNLNPDYIPAGPQADAHSAEPCSVCDQRGGHLPGCVGVLDGVPLTIDEWTEPVCRFSRVGHE